MSQNRNGSQIDIGLRTSAVLALPKTVICLSLLFTSFSRCLARYDNLGRRPDLAATAVFVAMPCEANLCLSRHISMGAKWLASEMVPHDRNQSILVAAFGFSTFSTYSGLIHAGFY
jgi:hypothetical protein